MPDIETTLLACREVGMAKFGVTLDFAHVLFADEMPVHSAALIGRHARMIDLHLNDGYGKRDDGLMVRSVHAILTNRLMEFAETLVDDASLTTAVERQDIALSQRIVAKALHGE